jgi:hypothetical protein
MSFAKILMILGYPEQARKSSAKARAIAHEYMYNSVVDLEAKCDLVDKGIIN